LGNLTAIHGIQLASNKLSGSIPTTLAHVFFTGGSSYVALSHNQLTGEIPGGFSGLGSLSLDNNKFTSIASSFYALGSSNLSYLNLSNNKLTFASIEDVGKYFEPAYVSYSPQAHIPLHKNGNLLSVSAGGTLSNNNYIWYKNGQPYVSKVGDSTLTIDNGVYYVTVSNSVATALTLQSDTVVVDFQFPPVNKNDSLVLVDIYNSTDGQHWAANTKWLTAAPVHTWEGVTVLKNRVTELQLWGALKNQLPSSIGNLSALTSLSVGDSYLTGSLPSSIGNLTQLKGIYFEFNNYMNANLPSELGSLTNLTDLFFYSNAIKGKIPSSLWNLKILYILP
jgi:Leucine-rich repeat (LRR) protein